MTQIALVIRPFFAQNDSNCTDLFLFSVPSFRLSCFLSCLGSLFCLLLENPDNPISNAEFEEPPGTTIFPVCDNHRTCLWSQSCFLTCFGSQFLLDWATGFISKTYSSRSISGPLPCSPCKIAIEIPILVVFSELSRLHLLSGSQYQIRPHCWPKLSSCPALIWRRFLLLTDFSSRHRSLLPPQ